MDLFSKAKEALSNSRGHNTRDQPREKPSKPREIQPMQKRTGILHRGKDIKLPLEDPTSPNMSVRSPTTKIEIPFSKNRYSKEANNEELTQENNKKAIKYLKSQKATRKEKEQKKKSLLEKRKLYNEQVRKLNKERLQKRRRNSSIEDTRERRGRQPTAPRSKSEDVQTKSHKVVRKYARNRLRQINRSEAKPTEGYLKNPKVIKTLSVEDDESKNTLNQKFSQFSETNSGLPPRKDPRVQINVDLTAKMNRREIINLQMDNSAQKNSTEEDETKYIKTPELNLVEKYSHKNISDNKISGKSTEKDGKMTKRFMSSHKKKSLKVSKEVKECKKDLIKLQK